MALASALVTGKHAQMDEVHSGTSVMSQSDLRLHFGLGKAQTVDLIEVKWPTTQKLERFTNVKANQILTIREGSGIVAPVRKPNNQIIFPWLFNAAERLLAGLSK